MATASRKQRSRVITELARRIASLRKGLGLGQRAFAEKVYKESGSPIRGKISHTQISEWERATETPSIDKLIVLARLARTAEERAWFWAKAGVTEEMVRATFPELAANRIHAANASEIVQVSLSKKLSVNADGGLMINSERSISLPAEQFGSASFIFCLKLDSDSGSGYFSPGDIAIIDRSPVEPQSFMGRLILMFFEHRPMQDRVRPAGEIGQTMTNDELYQFEDFHRAHFPASSTEHERELEAVGRSIRAHMDQSEARLGRLKLERAGGNNDPEQLSRFVLELGPAPLSYFPVVIPLTKWLQGLDPDNPDIAAHIRRPNHIVGRVIGWIHQDGAMAGEG
jgi:transcriptional regulator with XRE-family HTH domain